MTIRTSVAVAVAALAALVGTVAPARANDAQLLSRVIAWAAVMEKDGGALSSAADQGPAQADAAALKMRRDAIVAGRAIAASNPSSATGKRVRDRMTLALRDFVQSGQELHLAVAAAERNDVKGARAHAGSAVKLASAGGTLLNETTTLVGRLRP